jgi:hypothetical protein
VSSWAFAFVVCVCVLGVSGWECGKVALTARVQTRTHLHAPAPHLIGLSSSLPLLINSLYRFPFVIQAAEIRALEARLAEERKKHEQAERFAAERIKAVEQQLTEVVGRCDEAKRRHERRHDEAEQRYQEAERRCEKAEIQVLELTVTVRRLRAGLPERGAGPSSVARP